MPVHKYSKIQYKMYVLPVPVLMGLEKLTHHQELLKKGLLQEWTPDMEGRIIFVSHQWLGYEHPDPDGKHLAALQQLLKELMEGKIHKVETSWRGQLVSKNTCTVTAREWAAALPHMFIWMDYSGIPQVREETGDQDFEASPAAACNLSSSSDVDFGVMTKQSSTTSMNYTDLNRLVNLSASTDAATVVTRSSCSSAASSDHRFSKESSSILADLKRAIDSIPGYVERSSLMLVLVPPCEHSDTSQICNFSTWRSRGWCRVEFMAAHLSRKGINVMIDHGGSNPCFVFPFDALTLPAGRGNFSCCALNHSYNGVAIPCDKANLQPVIEGMVQRKVRHLKMSGQRERSLFYGAMRNRFLDGLPSSHELAQTRMQLASMQPHGPLAAAKIKERLAWNLDDDQAGLETGWSLLMCAALADDYETVRHLLKLGLPGINKGLKQPWPDLGCAPAGLTPLMAAMAFARFEIVEALLAAGANPHATDNDGRKIDAFSLACVWGRAENIEKWLEKFPGWNLERREGSVGATPLHAAVAYPAVSTPALKVLLAAGADPHARAHGGWGALNFVASKDDSDPEAVRLLLAAGVDVNRRTRPGSAKWKATLLACRSAYKLGMHDPLVDRFASVGGDTALHSAYIEGHSEIIQILKDAGADDELKNKMGQKPKDMMAS